MLGEPLRPGLYICRFDEGQNFKTIDHIIRVFNNQGKQFGVQFIPERPDCFQILNQEQEEK